MGESELEKDAGAGGSDDKADLGGFGSWAPALESPTPLEDDEVESIGDLGSEFDDPEGWMSERPSYWIDLARVARGPSTVDRCDFPTRAAYLRHRIWELLYELVPLGRGAAPAWSATRVDAAAWRAAANAALGLDCQNQNGEGRRT